MQLATSESEIGERAARFLKAELKREDMTYEELAKRLKEYGTRRNARFHRFQAQAGDISRYFFPGMLRGIELGARPLGGHLKRPESTLYGPPVSISVGSTWPQERALLKGAAGPYSRACGSAAV